jgi:hypothetical protein
MLRFSSHLLKAYAQTALKHYIEDLTDEMCEAFPEVLFITSRPQMHFRVERCVSQALSFSVDDKQLVARFTELTFLIGDDFFRDPEFFWIGEILGQVEIPQALRFQAIEAEFRDEGLD